MTGLEQVLEAHTAKEPVSQWSTCEAMSPPLLPPEDNEMHVDGSVDDDEMLEEAQQVRHDEHDGWSPPVSSPPGISKLKMEPHQEEDQDDVSLPRPAHSDEHQDNGQHESNLESEDETSEADNGSSHPASITMNGTKPLTQPASERVIQPPEVPALRLQPTSKSFDMHNQASDRTASGADQRDIEELPRKAASATVSGPEAETTLEDFEWADLERRYLEKMAELNSHEQELLAEYGRLVNYYGLWAQIGQRKESERSFKRLKTQIAFVQRDEDELEKKRKHHDNVIQAFQQALDLLEK